MKFPLPPNNGYVRYDRISTRSRRKWWHKYCHLLKSQSIHSFQQRQTPQAKLKTFDRWIRIIFIILIIVAILVINSVIQLKQSRHDALNVVDLTQNINANQLDNLITKIIPKQNTLQSNDTHSKTTVSKHPETNVSIPTLSEEYKYIQNDLIQNQPHVLSPNVQNEFIDWWRCPLVDNNSPKYIAYRELQGIRQQLIETKLLNTMSIQSVSNQRDAQTQCVMYKEFDITTDTIIKWQPTKDDLCPWHNKALFWTAMAGTHVGIQIRNMESKSLENHWMFEFKDYIPESCLCPKDVLFLYINNINGNQMFSNSMNRCDDKCLLYNITPQKNNNKVNKDFYGILEPLLEFIDNEIAMLLNVEYVMFVSGDDTTLMLQDLDVDLGEGLVEMFNYYDCDMLVCGAANSYPHWQRNAQGFENNINRWSRHHQHINSNIFMVNGGIENFKKYVSLIKSNYDYESDAMKWSFQAAIREIHQKYYPQIKIDSLAKIWTRVDEWMCDP